MNEKYTKKNGQNIKKNQKRYNGNENENEK
jgi:hypothetical protein